MPNSANRSPDVAWIRKERWQALSADQRRKFPPIAPDFVIELRSATDALDPLQAKIQEYLSNSVQLGWLINLPNQQVEIHRIRQGVETRELPTELSGEEYHAQTRASHPLISVE